MIIMKGAKAKFDIIYKIMPMFSVFSSLYSG